MTEHRNGWDPIVTPWHLDERPDRGMPAGAACAWLPGNIGDRSTLEAVTRLGTALGAELAWPEAAHLPLA